MAYHILRERLPHLRTVVTGEETEQTFRVTVDGKEFALVPLQLHCPKTAAPKAAEANLPVFERAQAHEEQANLLRGQILCYEYKVKARLCRHHFIIIFQASFSR